MRGIARAGCDGIGRDFAGDCGAAMAFVIPTAIRNASEIQIMRRMALLLLWSNKPCCAYHSLVLREKHPTFGRFHRW